MISITQTPLRDEFPLRGALMDGVEAADWITNGLSLSRERVSLCSAFFRSEALSKILPSSDSIPSGRILVRWKLDDLLSGASDLETFRVADAAGWKLYMQLDFHGKVYSIPKHGILVGSANATSKGFGFSETSNIEVCTLIEDSPANMKIIDSFFRGATVIDEGLLLSLSKVVSERAAQGVKSGEWPDTILAQLMKPPQTNGLLASQCLLSGPIWLINGQAPSSPEEIHDLQLLSIPAERACDLDLLRARFRGLAVYRWLRSAVKDNGDEIYFGRLKAYLRVSLADSPIPCRSDVTQFIQSLLAWVIALELAEFIIDRPNYSQRVRLVK